MRAFYGLLAFLALASSAFAWEIAVFETHIQVHPDSTATVTETIAADFTGEQRHGIYRDIPIHYQDRAGQHFRIRLHVNEVVNASGRRWPYRLESPGRYQRIRIGDPDSTVTGMQIYRIVYTVQRGAVRFFPDHDECYWNLTGNEWAVPIRSARAEIELPSAARDVRTVAFFGGYGAKDRLEPTDGASTHVRLEAPRALDPYEGITVAVAWGKGAVHPPSSLRVFGWWFEDNWVYGLPFVVFGAMLWLWHLKGRDPVTGRSRVVEYEPPDRMTPAELGVLLDHRADLRDLTSTVIDLAVRGYLRIEPLPKALFGSQDYQLVSLKPWTGEGIKPYERLVLTGLFDRPGDTVKLSDLNEQFYTQLPRIREALYNGLIKAGLIDSHPDHRRRRYAVGGFLTGFLMLQALIVAQSAHQVPIWACMIASVLSGVIIIAFGSVMPRRTIKGAHLNDRTLGFMEFLRRVDHDRIKRLNDPTLFERGLSYALAFGVAEHWARAFEGLYTQPPAWYAGTYDTFSTRGFSRDLTRATSSMGHTFTSQPRSSGGSSSSWGGSGGGGGGFSGGGGGGGGGGAW